MSKRAWMELSAKTIVLTNCPPTRTVAKYLFIKVFSPFGKVSFETTPP
jgi:hypothetical protein